MNVATKAICKAYLSQRPFNGEVGKTYALKCPACKRITHHVVRAAQFKVEAFTGKAKAISAASVQTLPWERTLEGAAIRHD